MGVPTEPALQARTAGMATASSSSRERSREGRAPRKRQVCDRPPATGRRSSAALRLSCAAAASVADETARECTAAMFFEGGDEGKDRRALRSLSKSEWTVTGSIFLDGTANEWEIRRARGCTSTSSGHTASVMALRISSRRKQRKRGGRSGGMLEHSEAKDRKKTTTTEGAIAVKLNIHNSYSSTHSSPSA